MKLLLINPAPLSRPAARILAPPLGLAYLASAVKAAGHDAEVLDADVLGLGVQEVAAEVRRRKPGVVGVTAMTPTAEAAYAVLAAVRPHAPLLILGGAHASALGPKIFEDCSVPLDAAVGGEAEETLPRLLDLVASGDTSFNLPGVMTQSRPGQPEDWPKIADLDALPFPDRAALPFREYRHPLMGGEPVATIITSRGCPYRCIFCDKNVCGRKWRPRSPGNVIAELEGIVKDTSISNVIIYDDLFTLDRERVIEICRQMIERGLNLHWKCEGRVNRVDEETLGWMKRAGCTMIAYGVETAKPHGLDFLRKDISVEQVREAFALTRRAGIRTLGYFMLGIPGETEEQEMDTVRLAIDIGADYAQFGILSPLPGTPLWEEASARGWVHELPARGPAELGGRRPVILDGYWTPERLDRMAKRAHRKFYFRPSYLLRRLVDVSSPAELVNGIRQAAGLLGWSIRGSGRGNGDNAA